ncbi:MAG: flagellar basal body P-ring formation chaperone FlgA [Gallionellaceae bacterium]
MDDNAAMSKYFIILLAILAQASQPVRAGTLQNHERIHASVSSFLRAQTQALPGKVSFQITDIDKRISLPACSSLEAFLPPGTVLNGNTSVGVRCNSKQNWSIFVQVYVKISMNMLTLKHTLQAGQTIHAEDIASLSSESVPTGTLTDPAQAVGKIMKYSVGSGQILRYDMVRAPYSVKVGESVQLQVKGAGFSVSSEGQALGNAADGDKISARTASGQIISGIAHSGTIEIIK